MQVCQCKYSKLQYRFAVTSGSPSIVTKLYMLPDHLWHESVSARIHIISIPGFGPVFLLNLSDRNQERKGGIWNNKQLNKKDTVFFLQSYLSKFTDQLVLSQGFGSGLSSQSQVRNRIFPKNRIWVLMRIKMLNQSLLSYIFFVR